MKFTLVLLLAGAAFAAATDVAMWDACGGMSSYGQNASDPSVKCPAASYCNFYNEWFWQCQPDASKVVAPVTEATTYPTDCSSRVALWASCGGLSSGAGANAPDASVCCPTGTTCRFYNEYFWQCQPIDYAAPPSSSDVWSTGCNGEKVATWGACGGSEHGADNSTNAAMCCPEGRVCNYYSTAFWQCQPVGYVGPTEDVAAAPAGPVEPASAKAVGFTIFSTDACELLDTAGMTTIIVQLASAAAEGSLPVVTIGTCTPIAGRRLNQVVASTLYVQVELNLPEMSEDDAEDACATVGAAIEKSFASTVESVLGDDVAVVEVACLSAVNVIAPAEPVAIMFTLSFTQDCATVTPLAGAVTSMILTTMQGVLGANGYATVEPMTCADARRHLLSSGEVTSVVNFAAGVDIAAASVMVAQATVALQTDLIAKLAAIGLTATVSGITTMPAADMAPATPAAA